MARLQGSVLRRGLVAGVVGAAIVALWFLLLDAVRGKPLFTPALLGAAVFHGVSRPEEVLIAAGPVIGYTVLHVLGFVAFGIVAAGLLVASEREPAMFIAFVLLFAAFEVFFFAALGAFGRSLLGALVWWAIFSGNLLASVGMLWLLLRAHPRLPVTLLGSWGRVVREGAVAGLLGAAVIMLWFFALDSLQGQPLRAPRVLGTALLGRAEPADAVLAYTVVHVAAFVGFGFVTAALVAAAEEEPTYLFPLASTSPSRSSSSRPSWSSRGGRSTSWPGGRSRSGTCSRRPRCSDTTSLATGRSPARWARPSGMSAERRQRRWWRVA
jgi:hypothetical protein